MKKKEKRPRRPKNNQQTTAKRTHNEKRKRQPPQTPKGGISISKGQNPYRKSRAGAKDQEERRPEKSDEPKQPTQTKRTQKMQRYFSESFAVWFRRLGHIAVSKTNSGKTKCLFRLLDHVCKKKSQGMCTNVLPNHVE